ncbi:proto-oncogene tyrosine-protein kinase receptor Ret-like [Argiope bruennichi]|uniref:proto-oncogene tyrosine-protein kinase receptor Ret-like n=1 Tax=Argiope bruennichi TaxID=94029 RepID=UPI002495998A|nr:proto-oncogene tyrosine-protein kinase receptor Ret-like [Argiope bruennichi]
MTFKVTCAIGNASFSMDGIVNVLNINDNAPTTQHGNITTNLTFGIKPGENSLKFAVSVVDKDSNDVNDLVVRIENDTMNLFAVKDKKMYENLGEGRNTFLSADIESKTTLSFPGPEYNFSVVLEDRSLLHKDRMVVYRISIINETELELDLNEMYEINVSRNAAPFARIIQLSAAALNYKFQLDIGVKNYDWLGITEKTGIIFIKDPGFMPEPSTVRRNVNWFFKNDTHSKTGNILLLLTIQEGPLKPCAADINWCSNNENQERCVSTCGNGSPSGFCEWRTGSLTSNGPTVDYATCSPDFLTCPDRQCDELEQMEPTLCPQDCAKHFVGEVQVPKTGPGLYGAVSPCFCPSIDHCICGKHTQPAEMRHYQHKVPTAPPTVEINNVSLIENKEETSTDDVTAPLPGFLTDGTCGPGCVVFASIVPAGLLIVLIVLLVTRRMRIVRMNKHKFVSSHISLSGVPSDYVDERSNSAQESRHTPSETSSFGKATIDSKWEFPKSRLQLLSPLGEGEFGKVMKAQAWNIAGNKGYTTVAVKMLKENGGIQEKQDLMTEFLLLKEISHPNIIRLLGASLEKNGQFYLIVEYAELGSLRAYLRKRRRHNTCCKYNATYGIEMPGPTEGYRDYYQFPCERSRHEPNHSYFHKEQLSFAWQIAKGMSYLSDMKLVHRDLATRNILLAKHRVVKISDFGLSRDIYEGDAYLKKTKGRVPVKWMAIESLEDQIYTSRSDVWSFGVVLWEIMMLGATPYPGITPQRLYNLLKAGYRMTKPETCSDDLYYLMRQCWRAYPRERPSFKELVLKLDLMLQDTVEYMDFVPKGGRRRSRKLVPPPNGLVPTLQYTSVLIENEEEECLDSESNENIGLDRLFSQSPRMQAAYNFHESVA